MIARLHARLLAHARAMSAAAAVTLATLGPLPAGPLTVPPAIVRPVLRGGRFDPREVVAGRIVLTMPLEDDTPSAHGWDRGGFSVN